MADCLFCKIASKEIPAEIVHETEETVAFKDINPAAPTHVLVIPKRHIVSAQDLTKEDGGLLGEMFEAMGAVVDGAGLGGGHRIVTNVGGDAGQSVHHLHFHVIGGRDMSWPPG
ncbi:MAG: histidine triad nucleotide-binding protein [Actinomycetota bacterium]|nr:histidine triad nucleotide-binding protein [Actinomycetota bacterium]